MKYSRNGTGSHLDRLLIFLSGTLVGMAAARLRTPPAKSPHESKQVRAIVIVNHDGASDEFSQRGQWSDLPAHEKSNVSFPVLCAFLIFLLAGAFVMHTVLWSWARSRGVVGGNAFVQQVSTRGVDLGNAKNFPRLQLSPERDLREYLIKEQAALHATETISRTSAIVQIPIDRAMALLAERGVPEWQDSHRKAAKVSPLQFQQQRAAQRGVPAP